jgi:hypothetical protein
VIKPKVVSSNCGDVVGLTGMRIAIVPIQSDAPCGEILEMGVFHNIVKVLFQRIMMTCQYSAQQMGEWRTIYEIMQHWCPEREAGLLHTRLPSHIDMSLSKLLPGICVA